MSQINNIIAKIISAIEELTLSIETLKTTRSQDGSKTHKIFHLLNAKSQKCESILHILERDVSEHLSGGLMAELSKITTTTKKINLATTNVDCQAMLDGFKSLEGLPERLQIISDQIRERSGSVVECLTRDRRAAGSSLTGVTALWSLSKTHLS